MPEIYKLNPDAADNAIRLYPTLRCNLACSYCSNGPVSSKAPSPITGVLWERGLKRLSGSWVDRVLITGGEPFLYGGLAYVVNAVPLKIPVLVYTNLTLAVDSFLTSLKRDVVLRGSLHLIGRVDFYRKKIEELIRNPHILGVYLVVVEGTPPAEFYQDEFKGMDRVELHIVPNQWKMNMKTQGDRKRVKCMNKIMLFGPDGHRYPCVRKMRLGEEARVPFWEVKWDKVPREIGTQCPDCGLCAACDGLIESKLEVVDE